MVLIFLVVVIVCTISSFEFYQVKLPWLHPIPIHQTSIHWIIRFGDNAGVLLHAATEAKNSSRV